MPSPSKIDSLPLVLTPGKRAFLRFDTGDGSTTLQVRERYTQVSPYRGDLLWEVPVPYGYSRARIQAFAQDTLTDLIERFWDGVTMTQYNLDRSAATLSPDAKLALWEIEDRFAELERTDPPPEFEYGAAEAWLAQNPVTEKRVAGATTDAKKDALADQVVRAAWRKHIALDPENVRETLTPKPKPDPFLNRPDPRENPNLSAHERAFYKAVYAPPPTPYVPDLPDGTELFHTPPQPELEPYLALSTDAQHTPFLRFDITENTLHLERVYQPHPMQNNKPEAPKQHVIVDFELPANILYGELLADLEAFGYAHLTRIALPPTDASDLGVRRRHTQLQPHVRAYIEELQKLLKRNNDHYKNARSFAEPQEWFDRYHQPTTKGLPGEKAAAVEHRVLQSAAEAGWILDPEEVHMLLSSLRHTSSDFAPTVDENDYKI